jgi:hypothetical protein
MLCHITLVKTATLKNRTLCNTIVAAAQIREVGLVVTP